jgi:hypothetical protein
MKKRFTNQDVIEMVKMGLSEDVIIAKIRSASAAGSDVLSLDTSLGGLKILKEANVPDSVIKVMINPSPAPTIVAGATPMTIDPNLPPPEVGVYWKDGSTFTLLQGQAVTNTKAGGRAGSFFTDGMRNQHWDATIQGPVSKNVVKDRRPLFYIYVPDGSDSSDYVLISLNKKGDRREFQIGSFGGVTGGKSGVKRDKELQFHADHVGIRMYKIIWTVISSPASTPFSWVPARVIPCPALTVATAPAAPHPAASTTFPFRNNRPPCSGQPLGWFFSGSFLLTLFSLAVSSLRSQR